MNPLQFSSAPRYCLEYTGPGKRAGTSKQVFVYGLPSLQAAKDYLHGKEVMSPLATVWSSAWRRHVVAIIKMEFVA